MANTAKLKQSAVAGKVPTTSQLALGELAVNTTDGKLFLKKSVGGVESVVDLTASAAGVSSFNGRTGAVTPTSADVTGALGFTPANKAGDTFTGPMYYQSATYYKADGYGDWKMVNYQGRLYFNYSSTDKAWFEINSGNFTTVGSINGNWATVTKNDETWYEINTPNASAGNKRWRMGQYASDGLLAWEWVADDYSAAYRRMTLSRAGGVSLRKENPTTSTFTIETPPAATGDSWSHILRAANQNTSYGCNLFLNGPGRTNDGGPNALTLRNDGGPLVLGGGYETRLVGSVIKANDAVVMTYANTSYTTFTSADLGWGVTAGVDNNWVAFDFQAVGYRVFATGRMTVFHQGDYNHISGYMRLYNISTGQVIYDNWTFVGGNNGDVMDMNYGIAAWVQPGNYYRLEIHTSKSNGNGPTIQRSCYVAVLNAPN